MGSPNLRIEVTSDLASLTGSMEGAAAAVQGGGARISAAFRQATEASLTYAKAQADVKAASDLVKVAIVGETVTTQEYKQVVDQLSQAKMRLAQASAVQSAAEKEVKVATQGHTASTHEARGAMALLGEETGVKLPRHVRSFLAAMPGVAAVMSIAFAPAVVIAIGEAIGEGIKKLVEWREHTENQRAKMAELSLTFSNSSAHIQAEIDKEKQKFIEITQGPVAAFNFELAHMGELGVQACDQTIAELKKVGEEISAQEGVVTTWLGRLQTLATGHNNLASTGFRDMMRELTEASDRANKVQDESRKRGEKEDPFLGLDMQTQVLKARKKNLEDEVAAIKETQRKLEEVSIQTGVVVSMPTDKLEAARIALQGVVREEEQLARRRERIAATVKSTEGQKGKAASERAQGIGEADIHGQEAMGLHGAEQRVKAAEDAFKAEEAIIKKSVEQAIAGGALKAKAELDSLPQLRTAQEERVQALLRAADREHEVRTKALQDQQRLLERNNTGGKNEAALSTNRAEQELEAQQHSAKLLEIGRQADTAQIAQDTRTMELRLEVQRHGLDELSRLAQQKMRDEEVASQGALASEQGRIKLEEIRVQGMAQLGQISGIQEVKRLEALHRQQLEAERANNNARLEALQEFIVKQEELLAKMPAGSDQAKQTREKIASSNEQLLQEVTKRVQIENQGDQQVLRDKLALQQKFHQITQKITGDMFNGVNQWIQGQKTFGQAASQVLQNWAMDGIRAVEKLAARMIENEVLMVTVHQATTVAKTATDAAGAATSEAIDDAHKAHQGLGAAKLAFKNTYATVSEWPVVGPVLAPILAAGAFAAVATFEHGGVIPVTQAALVHAGERVLTPSQNSVFERLIEREPSTGGGSPLSLTTNISNSGLTDSAWRAMAEKHAAHLVNIVHKELRRRNLF